MSVENAIAFLGETEKNAALRKRVAELKGQGSLKRMAELAAGAGFYFTEDEYRMAVIELAQGELSDESLNSVLKDLKMGPIPKKS
jgi:predicted ribosomally synthesized peptide with nif11-like leader